MNHGKQLYATLLHLSTVLFYRSFINLDSKSDNACHSLVLSYLKAIFFISIVLFICKTKSRLRRRHCGLARHFKIDPTETVALCFGYAKTLF
jgi:hypothetical protein